MTPRPRIIILLLVVMLLLAIIVLGIIYTDWPIIEKDGLLMGTIISIKAPIGINGGSARLRGAIDKAFNEMARVENVFSTYKPESEISRINLLKKGETMKISQEAFRVISKAIEYNVTTLGAFDITVKPLIDIWAKAKIDGKIPSEDDIKDALGRVGSVNVILDRSDNTISFKKDGMSIDLGGVAKGYAVSRAITVLMENGVKNAIVHAGGDMYCLGRRSSARLWRVGIQHPRDREAIAYELSVKDKSVNTSGDYERYFVIDGKRYSHIVDPRSGMAIGDGVVSATVIADDATIGDIYSTALCILGEDGLRIARLEGIDAVLITKIDSHFDVKMTEGFEKRYDVKKKGKL